MTHGHIGHTEAALKLKLDVDLAHILATPLFVSDTVYSYRVVFPNMLA